MRRALLALALLAPACDDPAEPASESSSGSSEESGPSPAEERERLLERCAELAQCYLDTCGDDPQGWDWCVSAGQSDCDEPEDAECWNPTIIGCEEETVMHQARTAALECIDGSCTPMCEASIGWP